MAGRCTVRVTGAMTVSCRVTSTFWQVGTETVRQPLPPYPHDCCSDEVQRYCVSVWLTVVASIVVSCALYV